MKWRVFSSVTVRCPIIGKIWLFMLVSRLSAVLCDHFLLLLCHARATVLNSVSGMREPRSATRWRTGLMFNACILRIPSRCC